MHARVGNVPNANQPHPAPGMDALAHTAVLALGSNLGESETTLEQAAADLVHLSGGAVRLVGASGLYVTEPVGGPAGQPDYINAVLEVRTSLDPYALLALCQQVEAHHHRRHHNLTAAGAHKHAVHSNGSYHSQRRAQQNNPQRDRLHRPSLSSLGGDSP